MNDVARPHRPDSAGMATPVRAGHHHRSRPPRTRSVRSRLRAVVRDDFTASEFAYPASPIRRACLLGVVTRMPDNPHMSRDEMARPTTDTRQGCCGGSRPVLAAAIGNAQSAPNLRETIAQAIWRSDDTATQSRWGFVNNRARGQYRHQADTVIAALGLTREDQWTPIQADGHRWEPRDEALAEAALALYGVGGAAHFPDIDSPVVRIEHETRWITPWLPARPCNPGDTHDE